MKNLIMLLIHAPIGWYIYTTVVSRWNQYDSALFSGISQGIILLLGVVYVKIVLKEQLDHRVDNYFKDTVVIAVTFAFIYIMFNLISPGYHLVAFNRPAVYPFNPTIQTSIRFFAASIFIYGFSLYFVRKIIITHKYKWTFIIGSSLLLAVVMVNNSLKYMLVDSVQAVSIYSWVITISRMAIWFTASLAYLRSGKLYSPIVVFILVIILNLTYYGMIFIN